MGEAAQRIDPGDVVLDEQEQSELALLEDAHRRFAIEDPASFNTYVLRHEESNRPIINSRRHMEWQDFLTDHRRAVIWAHVEGGKTQQVSVGRTLWELGHNPNLRVVVVSNTFGQAEKCCRLAAKYITDSSELKEVFPELRPHPGMPWTANQFTVKRQSRAKDPSFQTCGVHGKILGARIDLLILDDILGHENTRTEGQRKEVIDWVKSTLLGRLTKHARVWAIGMVWHRDDLYHDLARNPVYSWVKGPILDEQGQSTWPSEWSIERIEYRRLEMGPIEFARQMLCMEVDDREARFKREWIDLCLARGEGRDLCYSFNAPPGFRVFTGVDLGVRDTDDSSETVLFTIAVHPNEDREVLDIQAGRWHGPDIVERIIDTHRRYGSLMVVENVAAQEWMVQFVRQRSAVPIRPFTTTGTALRHVEFGLETLAAEMAGAKWIIPNTLGQPRPEVQKWLNELHYYDPSGHAGDRLMASWFAREGARIGAKRKAKVRRVDLLSR